MGEHTPTPWWIGSLAAGGVGIWADQGPITVQPAKAAGLDDAAFIVRAVNAHEALVEALDRTLNWLTSYPGGGALGAYEQAREALSLARGEQP